MPTSDSDPRVFFAAERTLLAWLRTGITIMALGFVIARFGLFMQLAAISSQLKGMSPTSAFSGLLGTIFVLFGAFSIFGAVIQHRRFLATLKTGDFPPYYSGKFAVIISTAIGIFGVLLAEYLLISI